MSVKRSLRVVMFTLVLLCSLLTMQASQQAASADEWSIEVGSDFYSPYVSAGSDGSAILSDCALADTSDDTRFQQFNEQGNVFNAATSGAFNSAQYSDFCDEYPGETANLSGTVYGWDFVQSANKTRIVGFKNSIQELTVEVTGLCPGSSTPRSIDVLDIVVGADQNLYVLYNVPYCNNVRYMGINLTTEQISFDSVVGYNPAVPGHASMRAYNDGVVIHFTGESFRYYDYQGTELTSKTYYIGSLASNESLGEWSVDHLGNVYYAVHDYVYSRQSPVGCQAKDITERVIKVKIDGTTLTYDTNPLCMYAEHVLAAPSNRAVLVNALKGPSQYAPPVAQSPVALLKADGTVEIPSVPLKANVQLAQYSDSNKVSVGGNGNMLIQRDIKNTALMRYSTEFVLLSPGGSILARYDSLNLFIAANGGDSYRAFGKAAMNNGSVYVLACQSTFNSSCSNGPVVLHRLLFAEASYRYPEATVIGASTPEVTLNYVALGDSFSSGEGVPGFYPETDMHDVNECHRSPQAYPVLMDASYTTRLLLAVDGLRACSGATTDSIITGDWGEDSQLFYLSEQIDVVTVTAGGNDVGFKTFATACVLGVLGCDKNDAAYSTIITNINSSGFATDLHELYVAIQSEIDAGTKVLVVGYPYVAEYGAFPDTANCPIFDDSSADPLTNEPAAIRSVIDQLNTVIATEVAKMGSQFEYVSTTAPGSPFFGHEICTEDPYFSYVNYWNQEYSFHPNAKGHEVYAQLIEEALEN